MKELISEVQGGNNKNVVIDESRTYSFFLGKTIYFHHQIAHDVMMLGQVLNLPENFLELILSGSVKHLIHVAMETTTLQEGFAPRTTAPARKHTRH